MPSHCQFALARKSALVLARSLLIVASIVFQSIFVFLFPFAPFGSMRSGYGGNPPGKRRKLAACCGEHQCKCADKIRFIEGAFSTSFPFDKQIEVDQDLRAAVHWISVRSAAQVCQWAFLLCVVCLEWQTGKFRKGNYHFANGEGSS